MNNYFKLFLEASMVGIITTIFYLFLEFITPKKTYKILLLFLAGFLIHLIFQITGVNKLYCKNCVACKKNQSLNFENIHPASI